VLERHERPQHDLLEAGRDEAGVDELDRVDLAAQVQIDNGLTDAAGVLVGRRLREASEDGIDVVARKR
jgi:hypothetical protein